MATRSCCDRTDAGAFGPLQPAGEPSRPASGPGMAGPVRGTAAKGQESQPEGKAREDSLVFHGQVLDPDGKPVAGALIVLSHPDGLRPPQRLATSGADGRFEAAVPTASIEEPGVGDPPVVHLAALSAGFGPAWVKVDRQTATNPIAIRLLVTISRSRAGLSALKAAACQTQGYPSLRSPICRTGSSRHCEPTQARPTPVTCGVT